MKNRISIDGKQTDVQDVMNPPGMFVEGKRRREYSRKDLLPLSGKLIPEFDRRRNIGDMFARKPSLSRPQTTVTSSTGLDGALSVGKEPGANFNNSMPAASATTTQVSESATKSAISSPSPTRKRSMADLSTNKPLKRAKSGSVAAKTPPLVAKGQQSLKGFFKSRIIPAAATASILINPQATPLSSENTTSSHALLPAADLAEKSSTTGFDLQTGAATSMVDTLPSNMPDTSQMDGSDAVDVSPLTNYAGIRADDNLVHDPIESKESWTKLFTKPAAPRCEGHNEPCISLLTKKSGMNCGRSFWMCPRPIGPSGAKEKNTQWRCQTFIWCSDWNSNSA